MEMLTCPSCKGRKGGTAFVCGPGSDGMRWMACSTCKGSGEVAEEHAARIQYGRLMVADRRRRNLTLREEAARLGVSFGEWSRIENGGEPETDEGRRALETRRGERLRPPPEHIPDRHVYEAPAGGWTLCARCGKGPLADVHVTANAGT